MVNSMVNLVQLVNRLKIFTVVSVKDSHFKMKCLSNYQFHDMVSLPSMDSVDPVI